MREGAKTHSLSGYLDRLVKKREALKGELNAIHQSWSWKLMAPLRLVDDYLRRQRRKKHLKSRAVTSHD